MLKITVPGAEYFSEETNQFYTVKPVELQLEHSLLSIAKWEAKWHKAFLSDNDKTNEEIVDYIRCMTFSPTTVDPMVYQNLTPQIIDTIRQYIDDPMTASKFYDEDDNDGSRQETTTSELIYYWMIALQIPSEYQKWHINRLLTLIKICNIKNKPPKKHSKDELRMRNAELNAKRRAALNTRG